MNISVVKNPVQPEPVEVIAESIIAISQAMKTICASRLSRKALVALIHDQSRIGKRDIEIVLNNLECLERDWLKPKPAKP